jgi:hypothetical protein
VILDAEVPGGAYDPVTRVGWKLKQGVWRWYGPKVGAPGGIRKIVLRDRSDKAPGLVKFSVVGEGGTYNPLIRYYGGYYGTYSVVWLDPALVLPDSGQCFEALLGYCTAGSDRTRCH